MVGSMSPGVQFFLIVSLAILSCSFVFARPLDQYSPKTCVFNLSASIERSNEILSFNPETLVRQRNQQQPKKHRSNSPLLSLKLYSRDTLNKSPFKSYRELTLSRIQREKARLSFINNGRNNKSSSSDSFFTPVDMDSQAPVTSSLYIGEYFAQIGFGTPSQQVYTIIDTGSVVTWVPCFSSIFDRSASQSYTLLTCDAPTCQELGIGGGKHCVQNTCQYKLSYVGGTPSEGDFGTDTLHLGDSDIPDFPFGCNAQAKDTYGLLGLGRGSLSLPSLQQASSFSYCLLDRDSTAASTLDVGSVHIPSGAVIAPMIRNRGDDRFYYVGLTGISVGGERLGIPASAFEIDQYSGTGGVVLDSGTTLTYFFPQVYRALRDAFVNKLTGLPPPEEEGSGICFQLTSELNDLPVIDFHFDDQTLSLSGKTYLVREDENIYCFAFAPTGPRFVSSIIGNVQQQELLVTYDLERSLIGFSHNPNCQG